MPAHETLPDGTFSERDCAFLAGLEEDLRPKNTILDYEFDLRVHDHDMYRLIADKSYDMAPDDLQLRGFYFTELLLVAMAVRRVGKIDRFNPDWAEHPPILNQV